MAASDIKQTLTKQLGELRLPTFGDPYEPIARQAERDTLSYEQY